MRNSIFPKREPGSNSWLLSFSWEQREFENSFSLLQNNTLSRSELSESPGVAANIHYGDVLIKFGEYLDIEDETFPWIKKQTDADKFKMSFLQDGDIVFADTAEDETAGKCCEIRNCGSTVIISGLHTIPCRPESKFSPGYLGYYLNSTAFHEQLIPLMQGTKVVSISKTALKSTNIQYPSDDKEQQKIGQLFQALDRLITLHQRKYDKLTKVKKSMLEKMFPKNGSDVPEIRFSGFTDAWEQRKFSDITFPAGEKNKDNLPLESYSITNEAGFVPQDEKFENGGTMREADKRMYYIVTPNSFAYNPARINVGSIGYQNTLKNVIVSSLYEVFKTTDDVNDRLLWHWFKSPDFRKLIEQLQEGGVRLYFYYDKLCMGKVYLPEIDEQGKIGSFFDTLDHLITLHQRECFFSRIRKKLKITSQKTNAWEQRKLGEITNSYSGGTPAVGIKEYYDGTIPFIRSAEINREKTELFISELGLQNSSARYVYPGNILYALYGATSGEVGRSKLKGAINQAILAIIPHKGFDAEFIMQWLRKSKKNIVDTFLQGGQGNLSGAIVKNIELELPEDYEQQKIGIFFQSLDRLITLHQRERLFLILEEILC